jgi:hypothetical protein
MTNYNDPRIITEDDLKKKHKSNFWLEDQEFISKMNFYDKFYITNLCEHISNFLKTIPIPIMSTWDPKNCGIYFHLGKIKKFFEIDVNISYWDYTTLVKRWLRQFFPQYKVIDEVETELSDVEILEMIRKGIDKNDALLLTKKVNKEDFGIISKINMTGDQFVLERNDQEYIRVSGMMKKLLPLSLFLKQIRQIKNDRDKRDFIFKNSEEIKKINKNEKSKIVIEYKDNMMFNFFTINYPDLKNTNIEKISTHLYYWGRFQIVFNSDNVERECIKYVTEKRIEDELYEK